MTCTIFGAIDRNIARCRLLLSPVVLVAVLINPTRPTWSLWVPFAKDPLAIDPYALGVAVMHLVYSLAILWMVTHNERALARLARITDWSDGLFGAAILFFTETTASPFYGVFVFAVLISGLRAGLRRTVLVTAVSVGLYLSLELISAPGNVHSYLWRPVCLAIIGYLAGYLGQQRLDLEAKASQVVAAKQGERIARDLHDSCVQALAALNMRLASCQHLLQRGQVEEVLSHLAELQATTKLEYDGLRTYMRSLAGQDVAVTAAAGRAAIDAQISISAEFVGSVDLAEQVLQIIREGITNVRHHAQARSAMIRVRSVDSHVLINIDDDGVGFRHGAPQPWSIASRVRDLGGRVRVTGAAGFGAHLAIALPQRV